MNYSNYRITLDVRKTVSNVQLTAKKGDVGRRIYITLSDKGKPCEIAEGSYAVFAGVKPDGTLLYNKTTVENNTIIYEMTQQTTAVAGLVACEVKLFDSVSNLLTSPKLTILVDDVVVPDEEIVSKDEITAFAELVFDARSMIDLGHDTIEAGNAATEAANTAAQSANYAASGANQAAESANSAAGRAESGATNATKAAEAANTATANANNATGEARAATEETNTARENFLQASGDVLTSLSNAAFAPFVECTATGQVVAVNDASNKQLRGIIVYGKTTQNGTPSPENPTLESVGDSGSVGVTVKNNNLISLPYSDGVDYTANGLTFVDNKDGSVTVNGTATAETFFALTHANNPLRLPKGKIHISGMPSGTYGGSLRPQFWFRNSNNTIRGSAYAEGKTFDIPEADDYYLAIDIVAGNTLSNFVIKPMVNFGETALPFESPINCQTLNIQTPNGLPGIPVSSGGNWTDADGQQYLSSYRDYGRDVDVHLIGFADKDSGWEYLNSDGKEFAYLTPQKLGFAHNSFWDNADKNYYERANLKCSHLAYSTNSNNGSKVQNGCFGVTDFFYIKNDNLHSKAEYIEWMTANNFKFMYFLPEPIETPIPAEEMAAYAALHTNKPNTTVFNDAGVHMEVSYVADTKTYIDQKFTELQNAILATGANV